VAHVDDWIDWHGVIPSVFTREKGGHQKTCCKQCRVNANIGESFAKKNPLEALGLLGQCSFEKGFRYHVKL